MHCILIININALFAFWFWSFFKNCVHALLIKLWAYKWTNGVLGKDGVYWRYAYIIVKGKFISLEVEVSIYSIALLHFTDSRVSFSWLCDACNINACFFLCLLFYKCLCTNYCINQFCFKLRNLRTVNSYRIAFCSF